MQVGSADQIAVSPTPTKGTVTLPTAPAPTGLTGSEQTYLEGINAANQSAESQFISTMQQSGAWSQAQLQEMASWATGQITGSGQPNGLPVPYAQVALNFAQTPMYQQRFPGMKALEAQGLAISPSQYVSAETNFIQTAQAAGFNLTADEAGQLIGGNVSPTEFNERVSDAAMAAQGAKTANPDVVAAMKSYYGVTDGDLTRFFLDPQGGTAAMNQRVIAAQIGGGAAAEGFNPLSEATSMSLAQQMGPQSGPLNQESVNSQFSQEANLLPLATKGLNAGSATVDQGSLAAQALGTATGAQQQAILKAGQLRAGTSSGGGGYGATTRGSALGSASEQGAKNDQMGGS